MKLFVCYTTSTMGSYGHPCGVAAHALRDAGHDPEIGYAMGWRLLPDIPFNLTPQRLHVKHATGSSEVPLLETDDGEVIQGSRRIVEWARKNPAPD